MADEAWWTAIQPLLLSAARTSGARCATVWAYRDDRQDADLLVHADITSAGTSTWGESAEDGMPRLAPLPNRAMLLPICGLSRAENVPQIWKVDDEVTVSRRRSLIQSWQAAHGFGASVLIPLFRAEDEALLGLMGFHFRRAPRLTEKRQQMLQAVAGVVLLAMEAAASRDSPQATQMQEAARREERRRIARELHDTVVQDMTSALLHVNLAAATYGVQDIRPALVAARQSAATAVAELRVCLSRLNSRGEGSVLLSPAVAACASQVLGASPALSVQIDTQGSERPIPAEKAQHLLRIEREALTNVLKHAVGATTVRIALRFEDEGVSLTVSDDGCGFAADLLRSAPEMGRFGLKGIQERAELMNARLVVDTHPGTGTTVFVQVPAAIDAA